jgi:hypothetical protein
VVVVAVVVVVGGGGVVEQLYKIHTMEEEEEGLPKIHIQKVGESSFAQKAVCFTALLSLASSERGDFSSIVESDARNDNEEIFT